MSTPVQRLHYFDQQFLRAHDFASEQDYHVAMRRRTNQAFHGSGIGDGLVVDPTAATAVTVRPGFALDELGREIVLVADFIVDLADLPNDATAIVTIAYAERRTDPTDETGVRDDTRWTEEPTIKATITAPTDPGTTMELARVARTGNQVAAIDGSGRRYCSLHVGPDQTPGRVNYDAQTTLLTLDGPTGVAIHGPTTSRDALDVNGPVTMNSATNPLKFSARWSDFPAGGANRAEISNDSDAFKTLMIVGNRSAGNVRRVGIWDRLDVNGSAAVTGAITPSVGDDPQHGIQFPANPGGGGGDEAYIRYAVRSGENTALIIGCRNDADDRISFVQGDRERLALVGGMAHMGTLDGSTVPARQVAGAIGFWGHGVQHGQLSFRAGFGFELVDMSADGPRLDHAENSRPLVNLRLKDALHSAGSTISAPGRLHIAGDELLYVLNRNGMVVGQEWGGNGNVAAQGSISAGGTITAQGSIKTNGNIGTGSFAADSGLPRGWGGGVHTWDVYAEGTIGVGRGGIVNAGIDNTGKVFGITKPFVIDHPLDPERMSLVHAAVEGPEYAVYYRGEGTLCEGRATIELPAYFEALVRKEGRTVQVTPVFEADETVSALATSRVDQGRFTVRTVDGSHASHSFYWHVHGIRTDVDVLEVEPTKQAAVRSPE